MHWCYLFQMQVVIPGNRCFKLFPLLKMIIFFFFTRYQSFKLSSFMHVEMFFTVLDGDFKPMYYEQLNNEFSLKQLWTLNTDASSFMKRRHWCANKAYFEFSEGFKCNTAQLNASERGVPIQIRVKVVFVDIVQGDFIIVWF